LLLLITVVFLDKLKKGQQLSFPLPSLKNKIPAGSTGGDFQRLL
jgi:hypothetical protein